MKKEKEIRIFGVPDMEEENYLVKVWHQNVDITFCLLLITLSNKKCI